MTRTALLAGSLLLGCATAPAPLTEKPTPGMSFRVGIKLSPASQLLEWLTFNAKCRVRLPVVLNRGQVGFNTRGARIGNAADAPVIFANDTALGVSLSDRAEFFCKGEPTCALFLEGSWRGQQGDGLVLDVDHVEGPVGATTSELFAYAEHEEGC